MNLSEMENQFTTRVYTTCDTTCKAYHSRTDKERSGTEIALAVAAPGS